MNNCIIAVDVQNDLCEKNMKYGDSLQIVYNINNLLVKYDKNFSCVIFTKKINNNKNGDDINETFNHYERRIQISRTNKDSIFQEKQPNYGNNLPSVLKYNAITNIYFCGLDFSVIYNSIIDAYKHNYKCYLLKDCTMITNHNEKYMNFLIKLGVGIIDMDYINKN